MNLSRKFLVGAIIALLPLSGALACTTTAWNATTGAPVADDADANGATNSPENAAVKRYSANCGLAPATGAPSHVTNNTVADPIYRARFYMFNGLATGAPRVFEAYTGEDGTGSSIFSATYDRAANQLTFTAAGTTMPSIALGTHAGGKWYSIEFFHNAGNALTVSVEGSNGGVTDTAPLTSTSVGAVAGTVQSVRLGNVAGAALTFGAPPAPSNSHGFSVDEFDSTRSAATPIGRLCRGDANGVVPVAINIFDRVQVNNEILTTSISPGQPDCVEDGTVNIFDRVCVNNIILQAGGACP